MTPSVEELAKELSDVNHDIATTNSAVEKVQESIAPQLVTFNRTLELLRAKDTAIRAAIKQAMEENDVKKFENDAVSITYVAPTTRKTFDSTTFKTKEPALYAQYVKESPVKGNVRIQVK